MVEPNKYTNPQDYEDDLNDFLQSDIVEEEEYGADGEEDYYDADGEDDYYDADGEDDYYDAEGEEESNIGGEIDGEEEDQDSPDDYVFDMDFSQFNDDDFKSSLNGVSREARRKKKVRKSKVKRIITPSNRKVIVEGVPRGQMKPLSSKKRVLRKKSGKPTLKKRMVKRPLGQPLSKEFVVKKKAILYGKSSGRGDAKTTKRIIVPSTQKVIVEGVDKFILGKSTCADNVKNIGYYKCKKLKELVLTINNNSLVDFNLELFNPSMPLDFLHSTSLNLNNKIQVGGGGLVSYSDLLFNLLANPTHIVNAKFTFGGAPFMQQMNQPLIFKNKAITGEQKVEPMQIQLQVDNMQVANDIVFFDIYGNLNRPFIPDGMDVIQYKVLAGSTVTFAFFYEQKNLKKFFYKEARDSKKLL